MSECSICKGPIDTIPSDPPWTGGVVGGDLDSAPV
jgi:hypothetical protein